MDKIEVGEYVRLARCQGINKIIDIDEDGFLILDDNIADEYGDECWSISLQDADKEILKHSFNIIDLIEVGDIVNDYIVLDTMEDLQTGEIHLEMPSSYPKEGSCEIYNNEIKTILTHEQYERNCYKIN